MSDFLASLARGISREDVQKTLTRPYGAGAPDGESFTFPWGALAVLREPLVGGRSLVARADAACAWVGDLFLGDGEPSPEEMAGHMDRLRRMDQVGPAAEEFFARLNGSFAIISADEEGVSIITDPLNSLPVYFALDDAGKVTALGTHPDAVACLGKPVLSLDLASVGEFLNRGTPLFPHTIQTHVKEFDPGSFHRLMVASPPGAEVRSHRYWFPPPEGQNGCDVELLAKELTAALLAAIHRRSRGRKVAVKLSGGLDSRVLLAGIPSSVDCVTVTFCDEINREALTARKVAQTYQRPWYPLFREEEYVANNFLRAVRFSGCEHEWVHAHGIGLVEGMMRDNVTCVLDGQWSNAFLRLYFAADFARINRFGGLLPARYEKVAFDYPGNIGCFCTQHLAGGVVEQMKSRRQEFYDRHGDPTRTSMSEWLDNYPVSQEAPLSTWLVERRLMPLRMAYLDRQVVELGYRCPLRFKLANSLFARAALPILGSGRRIPDANNGVRPGSSHVARLAQRAVRKMQDRAAGALELLGHKRKIQHSWHDYEAYWHESKKLAQLVEDYGPNLDPLDGVLLKVGGRDLLRRKDTPWVCGFRLLQLAVWLSIIREYHQSLQASSSA
ncbi:MAG: hypothetical protein JW993_12325 [Sedimentisphaerales bacterium]|nr:hypothetical protein [Sedimentisphaerales bacterium]